MRERQLLHENKGSPFGSHPTGEAATTAAHEVRLGTPVAYQQSKEDLLNEDERSTMLMPATLHSMAAAAACATSPALSLPSRLPPPPSPAIGVLKHHPTLTFPSRGLRPADQHSCYAPPQRVQRGLDWKMAFIATPVGLLSDLARTVYRHQRSKGFLTRA